MKPEALLSEIARYAADKKAVELVELDLRGVLGYTDYFVVCSGNTERQTKAIHDGILEGCKREHGLLPRRVEGLSNAEVAQRCGISVKMVEKHLAKAIVQCRVEVGDFSP